MVVLNASFFGDSFQFRALHSSHSQSLDAFELHSSFSSYNRSQYTYIIAKITTKMSEEGGRGYKVWVVANGTVSIGT